MVAIGNPVRGIITPNGIPTLPGQYTVTSTFQQHLDSGRGAGIDIGNFTCGGEILSVCRFRIEEAFTITSGAYAGAKVVRYRDLDDIRLQFGIAHMNNIETSVGVTGPEGVSIGHIGSSGGVPCHLHMGCKPTWLAGQVIDEVDWWLWLRQNGAVEGELLSGIFVKHIYNRSAVTNGTANWRRGSSRTTDIIKPFPGGTPCYPIIQVIGEDIGGNATWFGCWLYDDSPPGWAFGYFHASVLSTPFTIIESLGVPQTKYDTDILALTKRLTLIKSKSDIFNTDIQND